MPRPQHIDRILREWPYDSQAISVRLIDATKGREVIQMRIDMGILQLETTGRPDGERPHGCETVYEYLVGQAVALGDDFTMTADDCTEADREFVQFYHRRICWLALRMYHEAVRDADHTLALMDVCERHSPDEGWTASHEQYRPFVMFHRTQAAALAELEQGEDNAPAAIGELNKGLEQIRELFVAHDLEQEYDDDDLVVRLVELRESLRETFAVGRTLEERLADAISAEQYELAASLRDQLQARQSPGR